MVNCSVASLWVQDDIPDYVRLCINSFLRHGHNYTLFTYGHIMIPGVTVRDAREILPLSEIWKDTRTGSLAPFSDLFRWSWLKKEGGIWVDADIACLNDNIPIEQNIYLNYEDAENKFVAGECIKLPSQHILAKIMYKLTYDPAAQMPWENSEMYERKKAFYSHISENQDRIERRKIMPWSYSSTLGLTAAVHYYNLHMHVRPSSDLCPVHWKQACSLYNGDVRLKDIHNSWGVHLWGHELRMHALSLHTKQESLMTDLLQRYGC